VSKQHNLQSNKKLWAWIGLVVAGLVLGLNALLGQQGNPLPEALTDFAEGMVATSVVELDLGEANATAKPSPATRVPSTENSTHTPVPVSNGDAAPWTTADIDFDYYVLALSWQPTFCETRPNKEECVTQSAGRYDAQNFALHGLWPNLKNDPDHTFGYCDISKAVVAQDKSGDWCELPQLTLSAGVGADLTTFMPGVTSCLHHHEWYKHGSCAGMSAEAYFALSNHLTELFSQTAFDDYVADHAGETVSRNELLDQFASEFGPDARDYFALRCSKVDGVSLLSEIQLALRPDIAPDVSFDDLFPTDDIRPRGNCPTQFKIDLVGLDNF